MRRSYSRAAVIGAALLVTGWSTPIPAQSRIPHIGVLDVAGVNDPLQFYEHPLAERGWQPGKNVILDYRTTSGDAPGFTDAAADLVHLKVDVILALSAPALHAARAATSTIPIIAWDYSTDPIGAGYAESYNRPGENVTGIFLDAPDLAGTWIEILRSLVLGMSRVAVLWDPKPGRIHLQAVERAGKKFGVRLQIYEVRGADDIDRTFASFRKRPQALIILPSPLMLAQSPRLAELALKHRLPATSFTREFADAGGAVSYGPDSAAMDKRYIALVIKVLEGTKPGDLPIERPTKFDFLLNMKTIKALGLKVPGSLLLGAEQVNR